MSVGACNVHVLVGVHVSVCISCMDTCTCIALPIVVGAWPMAGTLWRLLSIIYKFSQFCPIR